MKRLLRLSMTVVLMVVLAVLLVRRMGLETTDSAAASLLPNLPEYRQVEGQTLTTYIGALAEGAALLGAQPQIAAAVAAVDEAVACYQSVGAVAARVYSHRENPLAAGAVAVADLDRILDPETLAACVGPGLLSQESVLGQPGTACLMTYTLAGEDGRFGIALMGSTASSCIDLCSDLAGCSLADLDVAPVE